MLLELFCRFPRHRKVYTDGSKEDKRTAMSFVCDDHEFSCRINDEASICTAELLAIEAAIEYIWDSNDEEFMIVTDSLSSLQALKSQKLNNPIVSNILHMCHYLSGHKDIIFCWVHTCPLVFQSMLLELFCRFPRHRKVYTDGSKEDKRTAMSFVCDDHEFSCRINDEASICTAELLAIEAAIEYIWDSNDEEFMIVTDSLSSLQALKSQKLNNPIVSNILHMCHYLSGHKDIIFCWVPSHIGIQGNERADVLAKAALDKTKQFYYIPYTDFKYNISVYLDDILQGEWNINVTSKLFEVQPIIKRSFTPMERRRDDVVLCRARIGHAYFTNGYLLRGELRPMCCNTRLTVRHVLLSCAKYAHIRRKYFAFNSLFELFRDTPAGFIIQFLRECNLYYMF